MLTTNAPQRDQSAGHCLVVFIVCVLLTQLMTSCRSCGLSTQMCVGRESTCDRLVPEAVMRSRMEELRLGMTISQVLGILGMKDIVAAADLPGLSINTVGATVYYSDSNSKWTLVLDVGEDKVTRVRYRSCVSSNWIEWNGERGVSPKNRE